MAENSGYMQKAADVLRKKSEKGEFSSLELGKLPPQARDLEEAVLGALMIDRDALDTAIEILKPQTFYVDAHQKVFRAIMQLYEVSKPIDILTVTEQLRVNGHLEDVGGAFYVTDLTNRVASGANVEYHARIIAQKYIQRELIRISTRIIKDAYEDTTDVLELLDTAEKDLFAIAEDNLKQNGMEIGSVLLNEIKEIEQRMKKAEEGETLTGVGSGFTDLDRMTAGWQKSDLVIVAARPGMGKTAFTLALCRNAAVDLQKPVAFFSLEMSSNQLVSRLISMETELSGDKLRKGTLAPHEWTQLTTRIDNLQEAPIVIDDTPAINIFELRAKCRRFKSKYDIQMVVIDYLQLMSGSNPDGKGSGNREQEISQISRSLKSIAKELQIPVIALSQLSRAVETRGGTKRPQLSDLRESGAIEQDADMVIFLYRPEYYDILQDEEGNDVRGIGEIIIAKHRNGALGTVKAKFIPQFAKFANLERDFVPMGGDDGGGNSFGGDNSGGNSDFNPGGNFKTLGSRMNNLPEDLDDDDVPF